MWLLPLLPLRVPVMPPPRELPDPPPPLPSRPRVVAAAKFPSACSPEIAVSGPVGPCPGVSIDTGEEGKKRDASTCPVVCGRLGMEWLVSRAVARGGKPPAVRLGGEYACSISPAEEGAEAVSTSPVSCAAPRRLPPAVSPPPSRLVLLVPSPVSRATLTGRAEAGEGSGGDERGRGPCLTAPPVTMPLLPAGEGGRENWPPAGCRARCEGARGCC